ncbi:hypothetical protein PR048_007504 [Dryococelus australis]|uniref:Uncharacterized protein n=1 Tax=Dryococelus australis TaxID=614101 RepID=A0ABQ9HUG2_9NEOP|nr:hypothetical protein PR048_007504 [Dryococelus australis]
MDEFLLRTSCLNSEKYSYRHQKRSRKSTHQADKLTSRGENLRHQECGEGPGQTGVPMVGPQYLYSSWLTLGKVWRGVMAGAASRAAYCIRTSGAIQQCALVLWMISMHSFGGSAGEKYKSSGAESEIFPMGRAKESRLSRELQHMMWWSASCWNPIAILQRCRDMYSPVPGVVLGALCLRIASTRVAPPSWAESNCAVISRGGSKQASLLCGLHRLHELSPSNMQSGKGTNLHGLDGMYEACSVVHGLLCRLPQICRAVLVHVHLAHDCPLSQLPHSLRKGQRTPLVDRSKVTRRRRANVASATQPEINSDYNAFLKEYEALGHMHCLEAVPESQVVHYIPHHCVIKERSSTTKLRVVFDASAPTSGNSLNVLMAGPKLQRDVVEIITYFRLHPVVFTTDI